MLNQIQKFASKITDVMNTVLDGNSQIVVNPIVGLRVYVETPTKRLREIDIDNIRINEHGALIIPVKERWDVTL